MIEVYQRLWVGDDDDAKMWLATEPRSWDEVQREGAFLRKHNLPEHRVRATVSAAKEPYHRALVGYEGRGAPKDHSEYYHARRGRHLALNWVDVDDSRWFRTVELHEAFAHIQAAQRMEIDCLVHCNQGVSRSPALVLGYLHLYGPDEYADEMFEKCEERFQSIYPAYDPTAGVRDFIRETLW